MSEPADHDFRPDRRGPETEPPDRGAGANRFCAHAKLIGGLTFLSRILGLVRESRRGAFPRRPASSPAAFTVAFTIPNLFRKLLGEGALSAAFIPLYAQATQARHDRVRRNRQRLRRRQRQPARASILLGITIVGEAILIGIADPHWTTRAAGPAADAQVHRDHAAVRDARLRRRIPVRDPPGPPAASARRRSRRSCSTSATSPSCSAGRGSSACAGAIRRRREVVELQTTLAFWLAVRRAGRRRAAGR